MKGSGFKVDETKTEASNLNRLGAHYNQKWAVLSKIPDNELTEIQKTQRVVLNQIIHDLSELTGYVYVSK